MMLTGRCGDRHMRRGLIIGLVAYVLGVLLMPGVIASIQSAPIYSQVVSAKVSGFVFYSDGQTAAGDVPVRVWDIDKREFVFQTRTDPNGFYELPKLDPGKYFVSFDWMKLELIVTENSTEMLQQPHDVIVIIPRGLGFLAIGQLNSILVAATMSEMALLYEGQWERPDVVSP